MKEEPKGHGCGKSQIPEGSRLVVMMGNTQARPWALIYALIGGGQPNMVGGPSGGGHGSTDEVELSPHPTDTQTLDRSGGSTTTTFAVPGQSHLLRRASSSSPNVAAREQISLNEPAMASTEPSNTSTHDAGFTVQGRADPTATTVSPCHTSSQHRDTTKRTKQEQWFSLRVLTRALVISVIVSVVAEQVAPPILSTSGRFVVLLATVSTKSQQTPSFFPSLVPVAAEQRLDELHLPEPAAPERRCPRRSPPPERRLGHRRTWPAHLRPYLPVLLLGLKEAGFSPSLSRTACAASAPPPGFNPRGKLGKWMRGVSLMLLRLSPSSGTSPPASRASVKPARRRLTRERGREREEGQGKGGVVACNSQGGRQTWGPRGGTFLGSMRLSWMARRRFGLVDDEALMQRNHAAAGRKSMNRKVVPPSPLVVEGAQEWKLLLYTPLLKDQLSLVLDLSHPSFECRHHLCTHAQSYHPPDFSRTGHGITNEDDLFWCKCMPHAYNPIPVVRSVSPSWPTKPTATTTCFTPSPSPLSPLARHTPSSQSSPRRRSVGLTRSNVSMSVANKFVLCLPSDDGHGVAIFGDGPLFLLPPGFPDIMAMLARTTPLHHRVTLVPHQRPPGEMAPHSTTQGSPRPHWSGRAVLDGASG
ncbi:hypothetical protein HU200_056600 [Digitaria exilis]|uniref:Uncharacterized protein n=1 Tax=Digitaria exilis TaxID=1010633 RepID=A0A835AIT6_9POAL|nr:hypothetical protein HU200_056600 [Digitaria exilis]